jgi:hypothetical protein
MLSQRIKCAHTYILLLRHYTTKGDVSPSSRLVLKGKEVDVLQTKPMKIFYTSMPIAR